MVVINQREWNVHILAKPQRRATSRSETEQEEGFMFIHSMTGRIIYERMSPLFAFGRCSRMQVRFSICTATMGPYSIQLQVK